MFVNKHNNSHWQPVKKIFKYLLDTINCSLFYESQNNGEMLTGLSDANFAGDVDRCRSTTGYIFNIGSKPVT